MIAFNAAQKNIQNYLKAKPEYVLTTSEFNDVKNRLAAMHNRRKIEDKDMNKPQLRTDSWIRNGACGCR